jgi:hypothetical protein
MYQRGGQPRGSIGEEMKTLLLIVLTSLHAQSLVQSTKAASTSSVSSQTISFSSLPTVGNVVIVGEIGGNSSTSMTMADNQTNSYSLLGSEPAGQANRQTTIWCTSVLTSSGTFTITATPLANGNFISLFAAEYSGLTCNPDQSNVGTGTTTPYTCGSITTRNAKDLLVSVFNWNGSGTVTFSITAGWTIEQQETNGTLVEAGAYADQVVSSTGTFNPSWTISANATATCVNVALQASGGSGSGGQKGYPIVQ